MSERNIVVPGKPSDSAACAEAVTGVGSTGVAPAVPDRPRGEDGFRDLARPGANTTIPDLAAIRARADEVLQAMDMDPGRTTAEPYAGWAQREALDALSLVDYLEAVSPLLARWRPFPANG